MKYYILIWFTAFRLISFGQQYTINLEKDRAPIYFPGFYIYDVLDDRNASDTIGSFFDRKQDKKATVILNGGTKKSIYNYLNKTLVQDSAGSPVVIRVKQFELSEDRTKLASLTMVKTEFEYYLVQGEQLQKIYSKKDTITDAGFNTLKSYERVIKLALRSNAYDFIEEMIKNRARLAKNKKEKSVEYETLVSKESAADNYSIYNLFGLSGNFGVNAKGLKASYRVVREYPDNRWLAPFVVSAERFIINPDLLLRAGYSQLYMHYLMPGISPMKRIINNVYFDLHANSILGSEKLVKPSGYESFNFLIGFAFSEGILIIPEHDGGIIFGFSLYQKFLSSRVYDSDFGLQFSMGYKF